MISTHLFFAVSAADPVRFRGQEIHRKEATMKTPVVRETRRAGRPPIDQHRRQVALVTRSLVSLPERRAGWDERTRTEFHRAA
jgi:hypothetical protein